MQRSKHFWVQLTYIYLNKTTFSKNKVPNPTTINGHGDGGERWRIRSNRELEEILRGEDIVKFVKSQQLALLGHV
jgi:hypothetical protein